MLCDTEQDEGDTNSRTWTDQPWPWRQPKTNMKTSSSRSCRVVDTWPERETNCRFSNCFAGREASGRGDLKSVCGAKPAAYVG